MYNTSDKLWGYLLGILYILVFTYFSYRLGEEQFYLVPIFGMAFYQLEYVLLMPIAGLLAKSFNYKLRNVDVTNLKPSYRIFFQYILTMQFLFLALMYLDQKIFKLTLIWMLIDTIVISIFISYWTLKFFSEAKKQNVNLKNVSLISLYQEMRTHFASLDLPKEDSQEN